MATQDRSNSSDDLNLWGWGEDDTILSGSGDDTLAGAQGDDFINGGGGSDWIHDWTWSYAGASIVSDVPGSGESAHAHAPSRSGIVFYQGGNDSFSGGSGNDFLAGYSGNDRLSGDSGRDTIWGGTGDDEIYGGSGNDTLYGNDGDDFMEGGTGADFIEGGSGVDWASYQLSTEGVDIDLERGEQFGGEAEGDILKEMQNVYGTGFRDILVGNEQVNELVASNGNDVLDGRGGNDILSGGRGSDSLTGGAGSDTFVSGIDWNNETGAILLSIDTIKDFQDGVSGDQDLIDLSGLDGNDRVTGSQDLFFDNNNGVTEMGEIIVTHQLNWLNSSWSTILSANIEGTSAIDLQIRLTGNITTLDATDFLF